MTSAIVRVAYLTDSQRFRFDFRLPIGKNSRLGFGKSRPGIILLPQAMFDLSKYHLAWWCNGSTSDSESLSSGSSPDRAIGRKPLLNRGLRFVFCDLSQFFFARSTAVLL